jgi:hypothetical protein
MRLPKPLHIAVIAAQLGWNVVIPGSDEPGPSSADVFYRIPVIVAQIEIFEVRNKPRDYFSSVTPIIVAGAVYHWECALEHGGKPPLFSEHKHFGTAADFVSVRRQKAVRR